MRIMQTQLPLMPLTIIARPPINRIQEFGYGRLE